MQNTHNDVKETANDMAAVVKQLEITNQYLSSIQYLLLFSDKVDKKNHYTEMTSRIKQVISDTDCKSPQAVLHHQQ